MIREKIIILTKADFRKTRLVSDWHCVGCGRNTAPGWPNDDQVRAAFKQKIEGIIVSFNSRTEVYTVKTDVWRKTRLRPWGGCLCIGCLELLIGRRLHPGDFDMSHPFNTMPGTPRLLSRRGQQKRRPEGRPKSGRIAHKMVKLYK